MYAMIQFLKIYLTPYLPKSEKGQDLSEYGLLVAFIAIVVMLVVIVFGGNLSDFFQRLADNVAGWGAGMGGGAGT